MTLKYRLQKLCIRTANQLSTDPSEVARIDNINFFSKSYLESYGAKETIGHVLSDEGWIDVTPENAQEVIDELTRAATLEATRKEQESLNE